MISVLKEENSNLQVQNQELIVKVDEIKTKNLKLTQDINRINETIEEDQEDR